MGNPFKDVSIKQIEEAVSAALTTLMGKEVSVEIGSLDLHDEWASAGKASFPVVATVIREHDKVLDALFAEKI